MGDDDIQNFKTLRLLVEALEPMGAASAAAAAGLHNVSLSLATVQKHMAQVQGKLHSSPKKLPKQKPQGIPLDFLDEAEEAPTLEGENGVNDARDLATSESERAALAKVNVMALPYPKDSIRLSCAILKARIKGAAEARRTLRIEASKADGRPLCYRCKEPWTAEHTHGEHAEHAHWLQGPSMKCRMKEQRNRLLNPRLMLLAYGYLRGRNYLQIENSARKRPSVKDIKEALAATGLYIKPGDLEDLKRWLKGEEPLCHETTLVALPF
jgi:hypothetical protein